MKRLTVAVLALSCVALPAQAGSTMTVGEFLGKVRALKAKGVAAMFSSDVGLLKAEMKGITEGYRNDIVAARKAGRAPHSCPPPKGQAKMSSNEFIAELEKIPEPQRGMSLKAAFYAMMKKRYPCG